MKWGLISLGILVFVALNNPCKAFFGMGYLDLFVEMLCVICVAGFLALIVFVPYMLVKQQQIIWQKAIPIVILFFVALAIPQFTASHMLAKEKLAFQEAVQAGPDRVFATGEYSDKGQICAYDYGGRLTVIIEKRDQLLLDKGYIGFGRWWTSNQETNTCMLYLYCPPLAHRVLSN